MTDFRCTGTVTNTNGSMTCSTGWREVVHVNSSESKTVFTDSLQPVADFFSLTLSLFFVGLVVYLLTRKVNYHA